MVARRRGVTALAAWAAALRLAALGALVAAVTACAAPRGPMHASLGKPDGALRVATFNIGLSRPAPGELAEHLRAGGGPRVDAVAEILQRVRPDIVLLNEIDYGALGEALTLFEAELAEGRNGAAPLAILISLLRPGQRGRLQAASI